LSVSCSGSFRYVFEAYFDQMSQNKEIDRSLTQLFGERYGDFADTWTMDMNGVIDSVHGLTDRRKCY